LNPENERSQEEGPSPVSADQVTALEDRRRWLALYVLCVGMLMIVLDATIVNVALPSIQVLIGARFVQGVGGALTSAVILGMIVTMFPDPQEQAKAIGAYTFVAVAGGSIGLLAGGVLTQAINWHWIFFVNLPFGLATAVFALRVVPDREGIGLTAGADVPGAALLTGGLMLGVYTILGVAEEGWGSSRR
jgi:MFS family permease